MKKLLLLVVAFCASSIFFGSTASAQILIQKQVSIDMDAGRQDAGSTRPMSIRAVDPWSGNLTTYVPIWYVMNVLTITKSIQSTWDGRNWNIELPSNVSPNLSPTPHPGNGPLRFYVNGSCVQDAIGITHVDPASGVLTTYVPIWYVMQMLKRANITSNWDGTKWELNSWLTKAQVGSQMVWTSRQGGGNVSARGDVSKIDAPTNDPATLAWFNQMYWNYVFGYEQAPMEHEQYQPGGNPQAWGKIIGLDNGISNSPVLLYTDENQLVLNMQNLDNGYCYDTTGHHTIYAPTDEYDTFTGNDHTMINLPFNEQVAITKTYQEFDSISYTVDNNNKTFEFSLPTFPLNSPWEIVVGGLYFDSQWSFDDGKTWTIVGQDEKRGDVLAYYSGDKMFGGRAQPPSQVLIKTRGNVSIVFRTVVNGNFYPLGEVDFHPLETGASSPFQRGYSSLY